MVDLCIKPMRDKLKERNIRNADAPVEGTKVTEWFCKYRDIVCHDPHSQQTSTELNCYGVTCRQWPEPLKTQPSECERLQGAEMAIN